MPGRQWHAGGGPGADAVRGGPGSRPARFPAPPGGAGGGHVTLGAARGPEIAAAVDPPAGGARGGGDRRSRLAGRGAWRPRRMRSPCLARPRAHDGHPRAQSVSSRGESCAPGAARHPPPPTPSALLVTLLPAPSSSPLPRAPFSSTSPPRPLTSPPAPTSVRPPCPLRAHPPGRPALCPGPAGPVRASLGCFLARPLAAPGSRSPRPLGPRRAGDPCAVTPGQDPASVGFLLRL